MQMYTFWDLSFYNHGFIFIGHDQTFNQAASPMRNFKLSRTWRDHGKRKYLKSITFLGLRIESGAFSRGEMTRLLLFGEYCNILV
jgi:hypothetical protein